MAGVTLHDGKIFGTTTYGGSGTYCGALEGQTVGCGTVFELASGASGGWTETVLHNFNGTDGTYADANLIFDKSGNLYSTTAGGNNYGAGAIGVVFELSPTTQSGAWIISILYDFDSTTSGNNPVGGLVIDGSGNLYGATTYGMNYTRHCDLGGCGGVFQLVSDGSGGWTENVIYGFRGGNDGFFPLAGLVFGKAGNLYGTTAEGGTSNDGTVFTVTP